MEILILAVLFKVSEIASQQREHRSLEANHFDGATMWNKQARFYERMSTLAMVGWMIGQAFYTLLVPLLNLLLSFNLSV